MFTRLKRIGLSLAIVLAAFVVYRVTAVPLIEPAALAHSGPTDTGPAPPTAGNRYRATFERYFPAGAWERENPKVLESDQGMLLIKDYRNLPDGRVELKPCTMIFFPKDRDGEGQNKAAIVLQAPGGAILEFDEPFDLKRAKIGKLVGGQLGGQITITSTRQAEGTDNELRIVTRDVEMAEGRIFTPHEVDFRLGPNYGSGRQMEMSLTKDDGGKKRGPGFGSLQSFQLTRDVKMHLHIGGKGLLPGSNQQAERRPARGQKAEPPVEITCQGPFQFDMTRSVATFNERVDVVRLNQVGPSDQMNCEKLSITFGPKRAVDSTAKSSTNQLGNLEAQLIKAFGDPVVVRAPSQNGNARCQKLQYDLKNGRISLEGTGDVLLHQGSNELRAPRLDYQPATAGRLGRLFASGPGSLQGAEEKNPAHKYQARWTKELRLRPHEQNQVVSLLGSAHMHYTDMGALSGEEIHVWLLETAASAPLPAPGGIAAGGALVHTVAHSQPTPDVKVRPDRMLAMGKVHVDSPQLSGDTGRLEVWFQQITAEAASAGPTGQPGGPQPNQVKPERSPQQKFDFAGAVVRVLLRMKQHEKKSEVVDADLAIEGAARLTETKTPKPGEQPLLVKGDSVNVTHALAQRAEVAVAGQPALVEARGMSLSGAKIELEQANNRMWINGPGRMTLPDNRTPGRPQTLEVTWQEGMNFDGRTATFERSVLARSPHEVLKTDELAVTLKRRIDFITAPSQPRGGEKTEVEELNCRGGAYFENHSFDPRGQVSVDQIQALDLSINQTSGAINGAGPGWINSVRRGMAKALAVPGQAPAAAVADDRLTYLHVTFEKSITGNLHKKEVTFADQVKCIYGPVLAWDEKLETDDPAVLGPNGAVMNCDQLTVRQMDSARAGQRPSMELEALGNTLVENVKYTAKAHRLTYAQEKDLLILEGNGRSDAQLYYQPPGGGPTKTATAGKIMYWPKTQITTLSGGKYFDFGPFNGGLGTPKKK